MASNSIDNDLFHSSSSIMINDRPKRNSLLSSCCGCSRTRQNIPTTDEKLDVKKGFFKRIQFFKGLYRLHIN
jgi:hypothetical protein